jgi:DNA-3-methyladenine glycosylase I
MVVFYSGFKAATVSAKLPVIFRHFPDYETVANYNEPQIAEIFEDSQMIRNRNKISACVNNARTFKKLIANYGSFQNYVDSFKANQSFENLLLFKEELESNFRGLGRITTYHFLTDIGLPVLKPDRVICRIFKRLGLIDNEQQLLKTVIQGRKFAEANELPIRYIDIVFVAYGQMQYPEFGINKGICLENSPNCGQCTLTTFCGYNSSNE